ncbi:MAG: sulfatase [Polyangiaceae bacterium]
MASAKSTAIVPAATASRAAPAPTATNGVRPDAAATPPSVPAKLPPDLNVLFVSIDSLRADMPWAGYPKPIAPALTELESRAVSFTRAYAVSSYTSMSLGGLLAGKYPSEVKRDGYFFGEYLKSNLLLGEVLSAGGVHTAGAHGHGYFNGAGFQQGFDKWDVVKQLKWNNTTDENVTSPELEAIVEKQLSDPKFTSGRFFAWVHFMDPHDKYLPHDGIPFGKGLREHYDGEVTFTDRWVKKLLDFVAAAPWGARTVVVVSADHGEAFGEHKMFVHGFELWENLVHVPLFFVIPGVPPRRIDTPRSAVDLAPTFLELLGVAPNPEFRGTSLVPELLGGPSEPRDVVLDLPTTSDSDKRRALVRGTEKVIASGEKPTYQYFDLAADPDEASPVTRGEAFDRMVTRLKEIGKTIPEVPPTRCKEDCLNGAYNKKDKK